METVDLEDGHVDLRRRLVLRGATSVGLTTKETALLAYLAERPGQVVRWDELLQEVWQYAPSVVSRAAYFTWRRMVQKVEPDPAHPTNLLGHDGEGVSYQPPRSSYRPGLGEAPLPSTTFVGRAPERRAVVELFDSGVRWVTIAGPAGAGKTRLAQELARGAPSPWAYCELAAAHSIAHVEARVAATLGAAPSQDGLVQALRNSNTLILDTCEHLPDAVAACAERWLAEAPSLRVLTTSRVWLRGEGEHVVHLGPLPRHEAVALFEDQARAVDHRFDAAQHTADIAAIVDSLDALPLALKLAAARVRMLPPAELRSRLIDGLDALASARHGASRQRSMQATLDWSWSLLDPGEQRALEDLSVFAGGATEAAIAGVLALPDGVTALDVLERLVEYNLVTVDAGGAAPRYAPYAMVRAHAHRRLSRRPDATEVTQRHARWFATFEPKLWFDGAPSVTAELANFIAAIEHAPDDDTAAHAALRAAAVLSDLGPLTEALAQLDRIAPRARGPASAWLTALRGRILGQMGRRSEAQLAFEGALAAARELRHQELEVISLLNLAQSALLRTELPQAWALLEEARDLAAQIGFGWGEMRAARLCCLAAGREGAWDQATMWARVALSRAADLGDADGLYLARSHLARMQLCTGDAAGAAASIRAIHDDGDAMSSDLHNLALALTVQGEHVEASRWAAAAVALARKRGERELLAHHLTLQAQVAVGLEDLDQAVAFALEASALAMELGHGTGMPDGLRAVIAARRGRFDQAAQLIERMRSFTPGLVAFKTPLDLYRAEVAMLRGAMDEARVLLDEALETAREEGLHPSFSPSWARLVRVLEPS